MAEQIYRYKAFISYRHVDPDRRWAKWLIDNLEMYRTPSSLVAHGVPSHIGHLFRDDEEIPASSNLSNQIEEALKASQYLIVVCSPNTPKSQWCRHEIAYFRQLGKGDRILALLIEGEPDEAFPPELLHVPYEVTHADGTKTTEIRDEEPIASDVRPRADESKHVTERRALIRIAATLLGVSFDDLAQRDHQRAVHRQRLIGGAIAAAVLLVSALGGWYWDHTRVKTAYFAGLGSHFAEPFGIGTLSHSEATHRYASYEVQSQGGRVIRVRRINGSGGLRGFRGDDIDAEPWNKDAAEWRVGYQNDHVGTIAVYGSTGRLLRNEVYFFSDDPTRPPSVTFANASGLPTPLQTVRTTFETKVAQKSLNGRTPDSTVHAIAFTADGYIARRTYLTVYSHPGQDENGSAGRVYTYSPLGQVETIGTFNIAGKRIVALSGVRTAHYRYTATADLAAADFLGATDKPVTAITFTYDDRGNPIERLWTGSGGKPVLNRDELIAKEIDSYDDKGNLVRGRFFDKDLKPAPSAKGYTIFEDSYDSHGHLTRSAYFDAQGRRVLSNENIWAAETQLDLQGNIVGIRFLGTDGKPTVSSEHFAGKTVRYTPDGRELEVRWYGADGKPAPNKDGIALLRYEYDAHGNRTRETYFGVHGERINSGGYHRVDRKYDERNGETEDDYFDAQGRPALNEQGVARVRYVYDQNGYWTQTQFLDGAGMPMLNASSGAAVIEFGYDERGISNSERLRGLHGEPVLGGNGFHRLLEIYDANDDMAEQRFYDMDDKLALNVNHYAMVRNRYDGRGNRVAVQFLDPDGKPTITRANYASQTSAYDAANNEIETRYFDDHDQLCLPTVHIAMIRRTFNARGLQTSESYYDNHLKLFDGAGYAHKQTTYDARGNTVQVAYTTASGQPAMSEKGYAATRTLFDVAGRPTDIYYFGTNGKLVMVRTGAGTYAHVHATYGEKRQFISYFDTNGRPVAH